MTHWAERLKPAASRRTHLLLASVMWTVVGALLLCIGARWVLGAQTSYAPLQIAAAVAVGAAKAWFVLDKAAGRIVQRIRERADGRCLGGFVSIKTWALILFMIGMGRLLRGGVLSQNIIGLLYAAIGAALLFGARNFWRAWYRGGLAG